jgi:predicted Zn-dependent protease
MGGPARFRGRRVAVALGLVAVWACATNPVTGRREFTLLSEAQEIQIGRELDREVRREMGVYDDDALQRYVEQIGRRLAADSHRPHLPWQFAVVDVAAVNAFALPGGFIYVTRGLLAYVNDEAGLAGVLGHEIGHVTARHAAQAYTRAATAQLGLLLGGVFAPATRPFADLAETGLGLLFLKYSRDDELEADRLGAQYAARGGWDPRGMLDTLATLARLDEASDRRGVPNWLSTHPAPADRVDRIQATLAELRQQGTQDYVVGRDAYLQRIAGLVVGDNPREGVVRGNLFLHPELQFAVRFPEGWRISNGKTQVVAELAGEDVYVILQLVDNPRGRTLEAVARNAMSGAGFRWLDGSPARINGLDAYVGTYQGSVRGLGRVLMRAAHIAHTGRVYVLAGLARPDRFGRVEGDFSAAIESFRALSAAEAAEVRPNRLDFYVVRSGDTWQSIAVRASQGNVSAATLAIMNGSPPNVQPQPGSRIKIVVAG